MTATIRELEAKDAGRVLAIFREGIEDGDATFETEAPDWPEWDRRYVPSCRWVALEDGRVVGWAALSPVSSRHCYRGVAEVSVYVGRDARGRGVGRLLLESLVRSSETAGFWTLTAGVFPENEASLALHGQCGFRRIGTQERIGKRDGRWRDVVRLERRSPVVGAD